MGWGRIVWLMPQFSRWMGEGCELGQQIPAWLRLQSTYGGLFFKCPSRPLPRGPKSLCALELSG